jgi:putative ABC transport system permease protein
MGLWQDLRFAIRLLIKDRWFTAVAAMALALGIGANAAVFTFVNAVLIRGLPFDDPDRIIAFGTTDARGRQLGISRLDFQDWQAARSFAGLAIFLGAPMNISEEALAPEQFSGTYGSANMFQLIGQRPVLGRDFRPEDDRPEGEPVVIISNGVWKTRYGSDPNILGRVIKVNSLPCTVIGVMPPDMRFPFNNDVWMPLSKLPPAARDTTRGIRNFTAFGRLATGVSLAQGRAELESIGAQLARDHAATNKDIRPTVVSYNERATGPQIRLIFLSLMGAVAFVLLIACANVANLLLARAAQRSREIAVRVSLGASRWRIIRQLLIESLLLATLGGLLGLGLAIIGVRLFDAVVTPDVGKPYWMTFTMDRVVFVFLVAICFVTGIVFGLAPALHISRTDVNDVLKEAGGRSGTGGIRARRWTTALISVEIVLTLVLLAGAGFMMRSFLVLYRTDLGFDSARLLTMRIFLPLTKYPTAEPRAAIAQQIEDRLRGVSALQAVGLTTNTPGFGGFMRQLTVEGRPDSDPARRPEVTMVAVSDDYFDALGVRVARGREFNRDDGLAGHESAIVNQRFVAMHFPGEDPLGRRITLIDPNPSVVQSAPKTVTIVGVVPTIRQRNFQEPEPDPVAFLPFRADPQRGVMLVVRTPGEAGPITALIREEMRAIEPDVPLVQIQTMNQLLAQQRWPFRVFGSMFAIFAGIALVLSAVGLYAVTAYSVTQRTAEIGVRRALGAQSTDVIWLVLRRGLMQLAIGLPLGIAGAFGVGRLLQSLLVQTSARDPVTIGAIALLMMSVSIAACLWPARRATRLDPVVALRYE